MKLSPDLAKLSSGLVGISSDDKGIQFVLKNLYN